MTRAAHLLGIDLGAGSLKATLIRGDGSLAGEASHPVATSNPKYGWSEQNQTSGTPLSATPFPRR